MKRLHLRLGIALATFVIGIAAALCFRQADTAPRETVVAPPVAAQTLPAVPPPRPPASCPPVAAEKELDAAGAVRVAECFIIKNGYTDLPPTEDKSELTPEAVWPGTDEQGMRMRHDSLERTAFGYMKGSRYPGGWLVVFKSKYKAEYADFPGYEGSLKTWGRAVTMDAHGRKLRVEHSDFKLSSPGLTKLSSEPQTDN